MKIFLAAGGTGGHIFPALAVAEALRAASHEVVLIGVGKELEAKLASAAGQRLETIPFVPFMGKGLGGKLRLVAAFPRALARGIKIFQAERPAALLAFGGYPSFIPMLAAWILRVPRALHEQNAKAGLANRVLALLANKVYAVPGAHGFGLGVTAEEVPNPVRKAFYDLPDWTPPAAGQKFRLLVVGGSQGAKKVNEAVMSLASLFVSNKFEIVHQTGESDVLRTRSAYAEAGLSDAFVMPFIDDIVSEYDRAHLVVCRAGAMTAAEVAAAGRPAVFIPLVIAGAHQQENIRMLLERKAALKLDQDDDLPAKLKNTLLSLVSDHDTLRTMAGNARAFSRLGSKTSAEYLADEILRLGARDSQVK